MVGSKIKHRLVVMVGGVFFAREMGVRSRMDEEYQWVMGHFPRRAEHLCPEMLWGR